MLKQRSTFKQRSTVEEQEGRHKSRPTHLSANDYVSAGNSAFSQQKGSKNSALSSEYYGEDAQRNFVSGSSFSNDLSSADEDWNGLNEYDTNTPSTERGGGASSHNSYYAHSDSEGGVAVLYHPRDRQLCQKIILISLLLLMTLGVALLAYFCCCKTDKMEEKRVIAHKTEVAASRSNCCAITAGIIAAVVAVAAIVAVIAACCCCKDGTTGSGHGKGTTSDPNGTTTDPNGTTTDPADSTTTSPSSNTTSPSSQSTGTTSSPSSTTTSPNTTGPVTTGPQPIPSSTTTGPPGPVPDPVPGMPCDPFRKDNIPCKPMTGGMGDKIDDPEKPLWDTLGTPITKQTQCNAPADLRNNVNGSDYLHVSKCWQIYNAMPKNSIWVIWETSDLNKKGVLAALQDASLNPAVSITEPCLDNTLHDGKGGPAHCSGITFRVPPGYSVFIPWYKGNDSGGNLGWAYNCDVRKGTCGGDHGAGGAKTMGARNYLFGEFTGRDSHAISDMSAVQGFQISVMMQWIRQRKGKDPRVEKYKMLNPGKCGAVAKMHVYNKKTNKYYAKEYGNYKLDDGESMVACSAGGVPSKDGKVIDSIWNNRVKSKVNPNEIYPKHVFGGECVAVGVYGKCDPRRNCNCYPAGGVGTSFTYPICSGRCVDPSGYTTDDGLNTPIKMPPMSAAQIAQNNCGKIKCPGGKIKSNRANSISACGAVIPHSHNQTDMFKPAYGWECDGLIFWKEGDDHSKDYPKAPTCNPKQSCSADTNYRITWSGIPSDYCNLIAEKNKTFVGDGDDDSKKGMFFPYCTSTADGVSSPNTGGVSSLKMIFTTDGLEKYFDDSEEVYKHLNIPA